MPHPRSLGSEAEDRVAEWLLSQGWTLLARRYATHHGELDIVGLDGNELVFVEVKARRASTPEEALTPRKAQRLRRAAEEFRQKFELEDAPYRFDLVAVEAGAMRIHQRILD